MSLLPTAQLALIGRPNTAIGGMSPFFLRHGYDIDPLMEPTPTSGDGSRHPGRLPEIKYLKRPKDAQDFAQAAMTSAQQRNEENANKLRRQQERFSVGDKVWLDLRNIKTPQLTKKLTWQHAKYEIIAVPDALTVELNVARKIHKCFHVELVKRAGNDPLPRQVRDDKQSPPILDELGEPEFEVESILRARITRTGRGRYREALVKWVGWIDPIWEPIEYIKDTAALQEF